MINGKTILALIPARGGSKGIPLKNIKMLAGKPLIAWTIGEAKKSKYIDRLILSSEDEQIINVAKEWGCEVPFIRPKELAQDDTPGIEPVIHSIKTLKEVYDYICLLQPTSPLRKVQDIDGCIELCVNNQASSCVSITSVQKHPYYFYSLNEKNIIKPLIKGKSGLRRQDLSSLYYVNGAVYFNNIKRMVKSKKFITNDTLGYVMNINRSIDIDEDWDFILAEALLANTGINKI